MTPEFRIFASGVDVSATIKDRLISLAITDQDGTQSDMLEMSIDDRAGLIAWPDTSSILSVWLGFKGSALSFMGSYAVDGISGSGPAQIIDISATPADLKGPIRAPQTRAWEGVSLKDIAGKIASEAGLSAVVSGSIAGQAWAYLAQTSESDLHFLTRVAGELDATAKIAGGSLIVQKRGDGKTAAGDPLPAPILSRARFSDWRWTLDGRAPFRTIEAEWSEHGAARRGLVTRGSGEPKRRLRHLHASEAEAVRAADAALARSGRGEFRLTARVAGFEPALMAGGSVVISGLRAELDGLWHVSRVDHRLERALTTEFEATRGGA